MKKIIFAVCFLVLVAQNMVFADEIIDAQGRITPCKIETVEEGLVEYHKDGNLCSFVREKDSPIFNDYVDFKVNWLKEKTTVRYSGKILIKDMWSVVLKNENGKIDIPFYKIKSIGVYKP